jgi:hypothetical protein
VQRQQKEVAVSKLNVGVGADFPVDSAEPSTSEEDRDYCSYDRFRLRRGRHRIWRRGPFFAMPLLAIIVFVAMISLAISYPIIVLAVVAIAVLAFALRSGHWHDDHSEPYDRRDDRWNRQNRRDPGPQPDIDGRDAASGRS